MALKGITAGLVILCVFTLWPAALTTAQTQPKVVTLGADLTPEQRQGLLERFGAQEGTDEILVVETGEMRAAMQDIIPVPEGYTSVSSTALACGEAGSGLRVTTENITRVSAGMYAGALLTAGIGDANLIVAAPADATAEGMTALTGVFKGFEGGACGRGEIEEDRRTLAYRWLATTARLGEVLGDETVAADVMLRAQERLVEAGSQAAGAEQALDTAVSETGTTVPEEQRAAIIELLGGMADAGIDWGTYASGWDVQQISPNEVLLSATNLQPGAEATAGNATEGGTAGGTAGTPGAAGRFVVGTVQTNADGQIALQTSGGAQQFQVPGEARVVREGNEAQLSAVQPQDRALVVLGPAGQVEAVFARPGTGDYALEGVAPAAVSGSTLPVQAAGRTIEVPLADPAIPVTRDGQAAQLSDIQANDQVTVRFNESNQPIGIDARSAAAAAPGFNRQLLWCLLPLLLLPLLLLLLRRRKRETIVVEPGQSTVVRADSPREAIDKAKDGKPARGRKP